MAEFALDQDDGGHSWNNGIAHAAYADNASRLGEETARQILRADISSWIKERRGEQSQWSLSLRDGKMVTETGVSLQEMTDNIINGPHSDLVPENIKATAHLESATLSEATRLAVTGADRIVLPEQHLDAQGIVVSRYLSVWTKNSSDPTRYDGSRIDLGKNIRIEDVRTGTSFTAFEERNGVSFHQHSKEKHAFVLAIQRDTNRSIEMVEKAIITTIHRSHQETYSQSVQPSQFERQQKQGKALDQRETVSVSIIQKDRPTDLLMVVPRAVVQDTTQAVRGVAVFLRDKRKRKEDDLRVRLREKKTERLTLENMREKPVRTVEAIQKRHDDMKKESVVLGIIIETGVTVYAAPVILARLAEKLPTPIMAIKKSIERREKKELRKKNSLEKTRDKKELRKPKRETKKYSVNVQPLKTERVEPLRVAKERKARAKRGKEKGIPPRRATAEKLTPIALEKREKREKRLLLRVMRKAEKILELKQLTKKEKKQWVRLAVTATEFLREKKRVMRVEKNRELVAISGVQFAWIVWMMLNRVNFPPVGSKLAKLVPERRGAKLIHPPGVEHRPWVLLSIIWYLTAIREQGMQSNPTNPTNTTNNSMKKRKILLPQSAVIFAFAS